MFIYFRQHNVHSTHCGHKGLSRFCFFVFCFIFFCFVLFCFVFVVFFLAERSKKPSLACLATQVHFLHSPPPPPSLFFLSEKMKTCCMVTCHTGFPPHRSYHHTGLFLNRSILSQVYSSHGTIVCIFTTQVYFIGKVKILNYLPHRFVACFKVKQVLTKL